MEKIMTNESTVNDAHLRLKKMGINEEIADKLLSFKNENGELMYDSAFKITDLCEDTFIENTKDVIPDEEAKGIYQKALNRREFVSRYIENAREMTEPHYRAQRCCNIDHDTITECEEILKIVKGE
jgi:hypothetical protein